MKIAITGCIACGKTTFSKLLAEHTGFKLINADDIVCSPQEVNLLKSTIKKKFVAVTPGIRSTWSVANDQKRITTPLDAIKNEADYLVTGRPIYKAGNPKEATIKIFEEINFVY